MTLAEIKGRLRAGEYAWPGGYRCFFVTADGAALTFAAVRKEWRQVVQDYLWAARDPRFRGTGWKIEGVDVNWENPALYCDYTGECIESAYAEDDIPLCSL